MLPSSSPQTTIPLPSSTGAGAGTGALSPSVLIIVAIISAVILISAAIHLIRRYLTRRRRHSSIPLRSPSVSSSASSDSFRLGGSMIVADTEQKALIDSLPIFTLSSAVSVAPRCSADCAVCLSRFEPDEQLRLLPACHHAFHSSCIDTWLRATPSCPLCRASVHSPPAETNPSVPAAGGSARSESFRVEIGSVSRRTEDVAAAEAATEGRAYSLGSSFEYVVEEEIEAVVSAVAAHVRRSSAEGKEDFSAAAPPGETVAAAAGGSGRSWLRDYVDRIASSASSSFSSMRWRSRNEPGGGGGSWDLEGAEDYYSFYRWLVGA